MFDVFVKKQVISETDRVFTFQSTEPASEYRVGVVKTSVSGKELFSPNGHGPYPWLLYNKLMKQLKEDLEIDPIKATIESSMSKLGLHQKVPSGFSVYKFYKSFGPLPKGLNPEGVEKIVERPETFYIIALDGSDLAQKAEFEGGCKMGIMPI